MTYHVASISKLGMNEALKPVQWRIVASVMDPPSEKGEDYHWIVEIHSDQFPGTKAYGYPVIDFNSGTRSGLWIPPQYDKELEPPLYYYAIDVNFKSRNINPVYLHVERVWDVNGKMCKPRPGGRGEYLPAPEEANHLGCSLREGIWRAVITGDNDDKLRPLTAIWKKISPYLLEMAQAPEMRKMENAYWGGEPTEHWELTSAPEEDYMESITKLVEQDLQAMTSGVMARTIRETQREELPPDRLEHWKLCSAPEPDYIE